MMVSKLLKIRITVWSILLATFAWWGGKSVIRYRNEPLTTDLVYTFGDNENGIQFPLMTFCDSDFVSKNNILQECLIHSNWSFFIALQDCLSSSKTFKMSAFMNSLTNKRRDFINVTYFWDGLKMTEIENLDDQIWSRVFHPTYGPCYMLDVSAADKFKYIPYLQSRRPGTVR